MTRSDAMRLAEAVYGFFVTCDQRRPDDRATLAAVVDRCLAEQQPDTGADHGLVITSIKQVRSEIAAALDAAKETT